MEGIIILIVTIAAFLAMAIWVVVKIIMGPKLPEGHRFEHVFAGNKAVVIVGHDIENIKDQTTNITNSFLVEGSKYLAADLAEECARCIAATEQAFKEKGIPKADVNEVVFVFQSDEAFSKNAWSADWAKDVAAYSTELSGMFGIKKVQIAIIRSKYIKTVVERGQPAIHEMVHILNKAAGSGYNHDHNDPNLWDSNGADSIEAIAVRNWIDYGNPAENTE